MDHAEDYEFIKAVYEGLYRSDNLFEWEDIVEFLESRPDVMKLNHKIPRDQGYHGSLAND